MTSYQAKWPNKDGLIEWTPTENQTWQKLITRQLKTIENRACDAFIKGLERLKLPHDRVPQLTDINEKLKVTKWQMIAVEGTVQVNEFYTMLKNRQFPVANFIRIPKELDYLQQPDIFHEYFGHGPLLFDPGYGDFIQWYGQMALKFSALQQRILSRLFWFTIEFGLLQTAKGLRIFGGGILSSHQETLFALESMTPKRYSFDVQHILQTDYDYQCIQNEYFIIDKIENLYALQEYNHLEKLLEHISTGNQAPFINC